MLEYMLKRANEMLGIESDYHKERWVKVFEHKAGEGVTLDLGPNAINDMFERTKFEARLCRSTLGVLRQARRNHQRLPTRTPTC